MSVEEARSMASVAATATTVSAVSSAAFSLRLKLDFILSSELDLSSSLSGEVSLSLDVGGVGSSEECGKTAALLHAGFHWKVFVL